MRKQEPVVYVKASAPVERKEIGNLHLELGLKWEWNLVSTVFKPKVSVYLVWFFNYLEAPKKEHFSLRIWFQNSDFNLLKRSIVKAAGGLEKVYFPV